MTRASGITKTETLVFLLVAVSIAVGVTAFILFDISGEKGSGLDREFIYDISDKAKIPDELIGYVESGAAVDTGFKASYGIAVDSKGIIYVAGDEGVRMFDSGGNFHGEIELASSPRCVAVGEDGKIYIGMKNHVQVYNGNKKHLASWSELNNEAFITSMVVSDDDVFVADAGNRIVLRYDSDGNLVNRIGGRDANRNIPGFVIPSPYFDLALGSDGLLRVVNPGRHRIEAYTFKGDLEFWWGKYSVDVDGFCGCCNPANFAILEDGSFVTVEKGLVRAKVYDFEGNFKTVVAGPEQLVGPGGVESAGGSPASGFDLAVDNQQRILILDTERNMIRTFTKAAK